MTTPTQHDPRWGDEPPFHLRHKTLSQAGDWQRFFELLGQRVERIYLYGETGETNPVYIGDCLVTKSLGRFAFYHKSPFHEAIRSYFSPAGINNAVEADLWKDTEVKAATADFEAKQRANAPKVFSSSGLFIAPLPETKDIIEAKGHLQEITLKRRPIYQEKVFSDRVYVLEALLKMILESPNGSSLFLKVRSDIRAFCAETKINYDVAEDGSIVRNEPQPLEGLFENTFNTGDEILNQLLEAAQYKFRDRDPQAHRESLEKLWDAWERLKTLEPGEDKKAKLTTLYSRLAVGSEFRDLLDREGRELTSIGNGFMIRHTETDKVNLGSESEVDYLFYRLFSLIWLLLKETGRTK